jgi:CTP synthase (UTP-ammonia lyase)
VLAGGADLHGRPGTRAGRAYGASRATERYYCNFGLNPEYLRQLESAGLETSGTDTDGEVRIVELAGHRFFVGTLFVPQVSSSPERPHPLVLAFVEEAGRRRD